MKIVSYLLLIFGALLLLTGILFKVMHWPDAAEGIITGPIIITAGVIFLIVGIRKKKSLNDSETIDSDFTK